MGQKQSRNVLKQGDNRVYQIKWNSFNVIVVVVVFCSIHTVIRQSMKLFIILLSFWSDKSKLCDVIAFTGGMEELTLEQIKKKSELEEDIDFENGDSWLHGHNCLVETHFLVLINDVPD